MSSHRTEAVSEIPRHKNHLQAISRREVPDLRWRDRRKLTSGGRIFSGTKAGCGCRIRCFNPDIRQARQVMRFGYHHRITFTQAVSKITCFMKQIVLHHAKTNPISTALLSLLCSATMAFGQLQWSSYDTSGNLVAANVATGGDVASGSVTFTVPAGTRMIFVTTNFTPIVLSQATASAAVTFQFSASVGLPAWRKRPWSGVCTTPWGRPVWRMTSACSVAGPGARWKASFTQTRWPICLPAPVQVRVKASRARRPTARSIQSDSAISENRSQPSRLGQQQFYPGRRRHRDERGKYYRADLHQSGYLDKHGQ